MPDTVGNAEESDRVISRNEMCSIEMLYLYQECWVHTPRRVTKMTGEMDSYQVTCWLISKNQ